MAFNNGGNGFGGGNRFPRNNNPRTGNQSKDDTTSGPILYNNQSNKFLQFDYWGRYATIRIGTVAPGSPMNYEGRKNANTTNQALSFGDLSDLQDVCEEVMESLRNAGTFTSSAVRVGATGNALVEINNGSNIGQAPGIYLVIYKDLDQNNRSTTMDVYPFTTGKVLRSYDPQTGNAKEDLAKLGQFKKFYRMVKEAVKAFTMAIAHSVVVADKPNRLVQFRALGLLSQQMGVSVSKELEAALSAPASNSGNGNGNGGGRSGGSWGGGNRSYGGNRGNYGGGNRYSNGGGNYGGGNGGQPQSGTTQAMATLDDPIDINLSLGDLNAMNLDQFK